jgi:hypothetical protein
MEAYLATVRAQAERDAAAATTPCDTCVAARCECNAPRKYRAPWDREEK